MVERGSSRFTVNSIQLPQLITDESQKDRLCQKPIQLHDVAKRSYSHEGGFRKRHESAMLGKTWEARNMLGTAGFRLGQRIRSHDWIPNLEWQLCEVIIPPCTRPTDRFSADLNWRTFFGILPHRGAYRRGVRSSELGISWSGCAAARPRGSHR